MYIDCRIIMYLIFEQWVTCFFVVACVLKQKEQHYKSPQAELLQELPMEEFVEQPKQQRLIEGETN